MRKNTRGARPLRPDNPPGHQVVESAPRRKRYLASLLGGVKGSEQVSHGFAIVLIVLLTIVVFSNTLQNEYHFDDFKRIVHNPELDRVWPPWRHFSDASTMSINPRLQEYRPLLPLSLSINHWVSDRLDLKRRTGLHIGNIAIHTLTSLLLYFLFSELLLALASRTMAKPRRSLSSLIAALLFSIHPISGVPVNYLCARDLLLMQLFLVAATLAYVHMRRLGLASFRWLALVTALLGLALLSKQNAAAGLLVFVAFELMADLPRRKSALAALAIGTALAAGFVLWHAHWIKVSVDYLLIQLKLHPTYLASVVWPFRIRLLPEVTRVSSLLEPAALTGLAVVLASIFLAWRWRTGRPVASFSILAYWALLLPDSSFLRLPNPAAPYRPYASLPFLFLLLTILLFRLARPRRIYLIAAALVVYFGLASRTLNQDWRTAHTLWEQSVRFGGNSTAQSSYAITIWDEDPALAEELLEDALEKAPANIFVILNLGTLRYMTGRPDEGLAEYRKAAAFMPGWSVTHYRLSRGLVGAGDYEEAEREARKAADRARGNLKYQLHAASLLQHRQDFGTSLEYLARVSRVRPGYRDTLFLEGYALQKLNRLKEAEAKFREFLELRPDHVKTWFNLSVGLARQGQHEAAITSFNRVVELGGGLVPESHRRLAQSYTEVGKRRRAARHQRLYDSTLSSVGGERETAENP